MNSWTCDKNNQEILIKRCLELALNGSGFVSPNPLVGAVIVRADGTTVAEGWHKKYGEAHAEIDAINNAISAGISSFEDMILAVNLEPCTHHGKQPPCVDMIIENKFSKVIIGMKDPNPLVAGKGIERLKKAGIAVESGILEDDCKWINRFFCHYITEGMPYIILKIAQTIDGFIATNSGESQWITCEESRKRTHFLRSEIDAIMVGVNTVIADNPLLDTRLVANDLTKQNPKIIIIDSNLRTPANSKVLTRYKEREVFIVHSEDLLNSNNNKDLDAIKERINRLEAAGATLCESPMKNGKIHLRKAISRLTFEYCFSSLLVEGGAEIFSSLINSDLVDEFQIFTAPTIMGTGKKVFCNVSTDKLENMKRFRIAGSFQSGSDEQIIMVR